MLVERVKPRVGSLFAGIGGFDLGLEQAGWRVVWQVEKDKFCQQVLVAHWPHIPCHEEICTFDPCDYEEVELISAGFPCQDFSSQGGRRGLGGKHSALFGEVLRVLSIVQPQWIVLENVPGILTCNRGEDFATILKALEKLRYGLAWGVLDSCWFGLPQRRKRVFIVGHLGRSCPIAVLAPPPSGSTLARAGESVQSHSARTLTCLYGMSATDRVGVGFMPAGTYIRACPHPDRVRAVAGLPRRLDQSRYQALGNAVSVPVARFLGENILKIMEKENGDRSK